MMQRHPVLCMRCMHETSLIEEGPERGVWKPCGIMVDNMNAGCMMFPCEFMLPKPRAPVVDAEESNRALRLCSDLKVRRTWKITEIAL